MKLTFLTSHSYKIRPSGLQEYTVGGPPIEAEEEGEKNVRLGEADPRGSGGRGPHRVILNTISRHNVEQQGKGQQN